MYSAWVDKETPSNEKVHLLQFVIISEILVGIYFTHNGLTENCALFLTRRAKYSWRGGCACIMHAVCVIVIWSLVFAACIVFQTMNNVFWVVILYVGESYYYVVNSSIFKVKVMAKCQWTQSKSWGNACYYSKLCCNSFYRCGKYPIIQNL